MALTASTRSSALQPLRPATTQTWVLALVKFPLARAAARRGQAQPSAGELCHCVATRVTHVLDTFPAYCAEGLCLCNFPFHSLAVRIHPCAAIIIVRGPGSRS